MNQLKILIAILFIGITACDKISNDIVEQNSVEIGVNKINVADNFIYSSSDSLFDVSVEFTKSGNISSVWAEVKSIDGDFSAASKIEMTKTGNNIYSAKIPMSGKFPLGTYNINFYADQQNVNSEINTIKIGSHIFYYDNGQTKYPPVISNLNMPISVEYEKSFSFTLEVSDRNGLNDIATVYYELYRPDGSLVVNSSGITMFPLYDDGNTAGDVTAGDGIYSYTLKFPTGQPGGAWKFVFHAKDKSSLLSNEITQELNLNTN